MPVPLTSVGAMGCLVLALVAGLVVMPSKQSTILPCYLLDVKAKGRGRSGWRARWGCRRGCRTTRGRWTCGLVTAVNKMQLGSSAFVHWNMEFSSHMKQEKQLMNLAVALRFCFQVTLCNCIGWKLFFFLSYFKAKGCAYSLAGPCFFMLWYLERTEINKCEKQWDSNCHGGPYRRESYKCNRGHPKFYSMIKNL